MRKGMQCVFFNNVAPPTVHLQYYSFDLSSSSKQIVEILTSKPHNPSSFIKIRDRLNSQGKSMTSNQTHHNLYFNLPEFEC